MSTATATTDRRTEADGASVAPATFPPHRITIERYERMVEAGVYRDGEPVFLWHGRLVEKMTKGRPHALAVIALDKQLERLMPGGWHLQQEQPIAIDDDGMPEPDLAIVRGAWEDYPDKAPSARCVALIVEVAASSLAVDSGDVLRAYASQGVPVYWIVNLPRKRIEVYREPTGPIGPTGYAQCQHYGSGDEVPVVLDGVEVGRVAVADVLPRG